MCIHSIKSPDLEKVGENTRGDTLWCTNCGALVFTEYSLQELKTIIVEIKLPQKYTQKQEKKETLLDILWS